MSRMARRRLFQRTFEASSDSDIPKNIPFTFVMKNHKTEEWAAILSLNSFLGPVDDYVTTNTTLTKSQRRKREERQRVRVRGKEKRNGKTKQRQG